MSHSREHLLGAGTWGLPDWPLTTVFEESRQPEVAETPLLQEQGAGLTSLCGEGH